MESIISIIVPAGRLHRSGLFWLPYSPGVYFSHVTRPKRYGDYFSKWKDDYTHRRLVWISSVTEGGISYKKIEGSLADCLQEEGSFHFDYHQQILYVHFKEGYRPWSSGLDEIIGTSKFFHFTTAPIFPHESLVIPHESLIFPRLKKKGMIEEAAYSAGKPPAAYNDLTFTLENSDGELDHILEDERLFKKEIIRYILEDDQLQRVYTGEIDSIDYSDDAIKIKTLDYRRTTDFEFPQELITPTINRNVGITLLEYQRDKEFLLPEFFGYGRKVKARNTRKFAVPPSDETKIFGTIFLYEFRICRYCREIKKVWIDTGSKIIDLDIIRSGDRSSRFRVGFKENVRKFFPTPSIDDELYLVKKWEDFMDDHIDKIYAEIENDDISTPDQIIDYLAASYGGGAFWAPLTGSLVRKSRFAKENPLLLSLHKVGILVDSKTTFSSFVEEMQKKSMVDFTLTQDSTGKLGGAVAARGDGISFDDIKIADKERYKITPALKGGILSVKRNSRNLFGSLKVKPSIYDFDWFRATSVEVDGSKLEVKEIETNLSHANQRSYFLKYARSLIPAYRHPEGEIEVKFFFDSLADVDFKLYDLITLETDDEMIDPPRHRHGGRLKGELIKRKIDLDTQECTLTLREMH